VKKFSTSSLHLKEPLKTSSYLFFFILPYSPHQTLEIKAFSFFQPNFINQQSMASASSILPGRRFFPSAMAKQGVELSEELKGAGWYDYVKRESEWHPNLITEFWVGCEIKEFIHKDDKKEWKESGLTGKVRDTSVDIHTPCLSIAL